MTSHLPLLLCSWLQSAAAAPAEESAEDRLATALSELRTQEEREAKLAAERALVNAALVKALLRRGGLFSQQGDFARALDLGALAQRTAQTLGDAALQAEALQKIGVLYENQKNYPQALEYYRQSLSLAERIGHRSIIANNQVSLGFIHLMKGETQQGLETLRKGLAVAEEVGDREIIAEALRGIAIGLHDGGDNRQALEYFQKSLKYLEAVGKPQPIARGLGNIGSMYYWMGDHAQALEYFQKSLTLGEQIGYRAWIPTVLNNIGNVYSAAGKYAQALDYYQRSLELIEKLGQIRWTAIEVGNIGELHWRQGNYRQALAYFERALKIFEEVGERPGITQTLVNIATVHAAQGEYAEASASFQKALKLLEHQPGNQVDLAKALESMGQVDALRGKYREAIVELQRSLKLHEQAGLQIGIAGALTELAHCYYGQGDYARAAEAGTRAVEVAKQVGDSLVLVQSLNAAGNAQRALGQTEAAREYFAEAIDTIERERGQLVGGESERQLFFESKIAPYYGMIGLLVDEQKYAEAWMFAERAKGRVLLDILHLGRTSITKAMTPAELAQEEKLTGQLSALNMQISKERERNHPDRARLSSLEKTLQEARLEYESFQTNLYRAHPDLRLQRGQVPALDLKEVRPLVDDRRALLEFVVGRKKSFLFVLTQGSNAGASASEGVQLNVYPLGINAKDLARQVRVFRERLTKPGSDYREVGRTLSRSLLGPAAAQLRGRTELGIVPDGPMWELPFQALPSGKDGFLIQRFAVFYAPSLAVLKEMVVHRSLQPNPLPEGEGKSSKTLLALGNPAAGSSTMQRIPAPYRGQMLVPLLEAEKEVQELAQLYGTDRSAVYTRSEAREDTLKSEAGKYQVIHLATHSILDDQNPLYSHVLLAQPKEGGREDGLLEAWEVMKLDLHADLVVLSACQTARGRVGAGEGVIGMSWAFFVAGAPTLVVSQWEVDSASTTALMLEFHRNLISGVSRAEALRRAQLNLLEGKGFRRPYYWAAFVVMGNGV